MRSELGSQPWLFGGRRNFGVPRQMWGKSAEPGPGHDRHMAIFLMSWHLRTEEIMMIIRWNLSARLQAAQAVLREMGNRMLCGQNMSIRGKIILSHLLPMVRIKSIRIPIVWGLRKCDSSLAEVQDTGWICLNFLSIFDIAWNRRGSVLYTKERKEMGSWKILRLIFGGFCKGYGRYGRITSQSIPDGYNVMNIIFIQILKKMDLFLHDAQM